jgi:phenylacetate-CoA ligase
MTQNILKWVYNSNSLMRLFSLIPFEIRNGKSYRREMATIRKSEFMTRSYLEQIQQERLRMTLNNAYNNVPFYKRNLTDFPFDSKDLIFELEKIPFLTRKDVFENFSELRSADYNDFNSYTGLTGGTTGQPLQLVFSVSSHFSEWAFIYAMWSRIGYTPRSRRVLLTTSRNPKSKKNWQINYHHNELKIFGYDLSEGNLDEYIKLMNDFKPDFLYGMPSVLVLWAKIINENKVVLPRFKGAFCGSEALSIHQKKVISETFSCRVLSWYGQTEKVVLGGECECSDQYHLFPEYGYTELVDDHGNVIRQPNQQGEIIGTSFINNAMPLIRYRTGDFAEYAEGECECGRSYPRLVNVVGRRNIQFLVLNDNKKILFTSIDLQKDIFKNVYQWQFVQDIPGQVKVRVISNDRFTEKDSEMIYRDLESQCSEKIVFHIEVVDELFRTNAGKVKVLMQNITAINDSNE